MWAKALVIGTYAAFLESDQFIEYELIDAYSTLVKVNWRICVRCLDLCCTFYDFCPHRC